LFFIVFFHGVAIALGNTAAPGQIASAWGMNPIGMAPDTPIEVTTVNAVPGQIAAGFPGGHAPAQVVTYSSPSW
jgi:hypothetical protein